MPPDMGHTLKSLRREVLSTQPVSAHCAQAGCAQAPVKQATSISLPHTTAARTNAFMVAWTQQ